MEPSFTVATWFWLLVPMPLLILFSLVSLFKQIRREKKQKNFVNNVSVPVSYQKTAVGKKGS
ncbi:hypothetical protein ACVBAX_19850 [Robertmurraya sp. GLU-23]